MISACEEVIGEPTKRTFLHYISTYLVVVLTTYKCCLKPPFRCFQTYYLTWLQSFAAKCLKKLFILLASNNLRNNFLREEKNSFFLLIISSWDCGLQLSKSLLDNAPNYLVIGCVIKKRHRKSTYCQRSSTLLSSSSTIVLANSMAVKPIHVIR